VGGRGSDEPKIVVCYVVCADAAPRGIPSSNKRWQPAGKKNTHTTRFFASTPRCLALKHIRKPELQPQQQGNCRMGGSFQAFQAARRSFFAL
jgi:hypothetical protein